MKVTGNIEKISKKVNESIKANGLLDGAEKVYVATSGGADSMALLNFMCENANTYGIEVGAIHVNHGIRGATADRDAKFVADFCKANGIEFILFDASRDGTEVPENASEEWARQLRYGYFDRIRKPGVKIATAHTISDQMETFLFRISRGGSGLKGLRGIPVKRGYFIRPFLCINRAEVEQLVEYYGCGHITDETNLGDDYSRNKIRHSVVPVLMKISDTADCNIVKVCDRVGKAYDFINEVATKNLVSAKTGKAGVYEVSKFYNVHDIVFEEMLTQICNEAGKCTEYYINLLKYYINNAQRISIESSASADDFEKLAGVVDVDDNTSIYVTTKYITVYKVGTNSVRKVHLGENTFGDFGYDFTIQEMSYEEFQSDCKSKFELCNYADASKLELDGILVRRRSEGDTFKPACKMGGKLVKFMRSIPLAERNSVPIIENIYNQKVIWVHGIGFTDGYTPSQDTKTVYKLIAK